MTRNRAVPPAVDRSGPRCYRASMSRKGATSKPAPKGNGQILVRNVDAGLKRRLRRLAERNGHSMEEEVRNILRNAVKEESRPETGLGTEIANKFRGIGLEEPIHELRGYTIDPPKFDE
jgi:plasmid stability protein